MNTCRNSRNMTSNLQGSDSGGEEPTKHPCGRIIEQRIPERPTAPADQSILVYGRSWRNRINGRGKEQKLGQ